MSWLFSQALVEEYLGANSLDGEQFVQSSGKPIQQAYCAPDKMTEFSKLSRFGMTYAPLTQDLGKALLTLYLAVFHAKTSQPLEKAQELMESEAGCGEKWQGSFVKFDPDTHSWKTHQCSLLGDLDEFSETWPQWGLMRDGECWEQRTLEQTIRGTGFGLSPDGKATFHTPNTTGLDGGSNSRKALRGRMEMWRTPTAHEWKNTGHSTQIHLSDQVRPEQVKNPKKIAAMWPTPLASDWKPRGPNSKQQGLAERVKFPTPTSSDYKDQPTSASWKAKGAINYKLSNPEIRAMWPTPVKSDYAARRPSKGWQGNSDLPSVVWTKTGGRENPNLSPAQLNATWVEWLMGWPLGWTDLKPLAMAKFPCVQPPLGDC
jgi:hypothetical protein